MNRWDVDLTGLPGPLGTIGKKELHLWLGAWLRDRATKALARQYDGRRHLLFAICDHYEPLNGGVDVDRGIERVRAWSERYPAIAARFRDADGRPPRHSFFFPGEQYDARFLDPLAALVQSGLGEVEVHLHHDGDTRATLRAALERTLADFDRHGVIAQRGGRHAWAFIHGNWCLANARRDRRWCGVDDEMALLFELGCYADFTFPSAPDQSQPGVVNRIYFPRGDVARRRAYEDAEPARVGMRRRDRLLMIQGPIAIARRPHRLMARIESAALDHTDPPTRVRLRTWVEQAITIDGRPEWVFVKVHSHGAPEKNARVLLGDDVVRLHEALARDYGDGDRWKLHYVTAREMFNVACAAMEGKRGDPSDWLDYDLPPPPIRAA